MSPHFLSMEWLWAILGVWWGGLFFPGLGSVIRSSYTVHNTLWKQQMGFYEDCHVVEYMKAHGSQCGALFDDPPSDAQFWLNVTQTVFLRTSLCGVPCSELFSWWYVAGGLVAFRLWGMRAVRKGVGAYQNYQLRQIT